MRFRTAGCILMMFAITGCAFEGQQALKIDEMGANEAVSGVTPAMREAAAREVALECKSRSAPLIPRLHWNKLVYSAGEEDACTVEVMERTTERKITKTYRFDFCRDQQVDIGTQQKVAGKL